MSDTVNSVDIDNLSTFSYGSSHAGKYGFDLLEQLADDEGEFPVNFQSCLGLNQAYQEMIRERLCLVTDALEKIATRRAALEEKLTAISKRTSSRFSFFSDEDANDSDTEDSGLVSRTLRISCPFFKDLTGTVPPDNADSIFLKEYGNSSLYSQSVKWFTVTDKQKLLVAVHDSAKHLKFVPLYNRRELLDEKLMMAKSEDDAAEIKQRLSEVQKQIEITKNLSTEKILTNVDPDRIDWLKIAVTDLNGDVTAESCRAFWLTALRPEINSGPWTEAEDRQLKDIVLTQGPHCWEDIAKQLNTSRSAFQCLQRYREKINSPANTGNFTDEEDNLLIELVPICSTGNMIPWNAVAYYLEGRTGAQCKARYRQIVPKTTGFWTMEEDAKLMRAYNIYGPRWTKVAESVGTRTAHQCLYRHAKYLKREITFSVWSKEDDEKLLELNNQMPRKWMKIAAHFPGRTDHAVKNRIRHLLRWSDVEREFGKQAGFLHLCLNSRRLGLLKGTIADRKQILQRMKQEHKDRRNRIMKRLKQIDEVSELYTSNDSSHVVDSKVFDQSTAIDQERMTLNSELLHMSDQVTMLEQQIRSDELLLKKELKNADMNATPTNAQDRSRILRSLKKFMQIDSLLSKAQDNISSEDNTLSRMLKNCDDSDAVANRKRRVYMRILNLPQNVSVKQMVETLNEVNDSKIKKEPVESLSSTNDQWVDRIRHLVQSKSPDVRNFLRFKKFTADDYGLVPRSPAEEKQWRKLCRTRLAEATMKLLNVEKPAERARRKSSYSRSSSSSASNKNASFQHLNGESTEVQLISNRNTFCESLQKANADEVLSFLDQLDSDSQSQELTASGFRSPKEAHQDVANKPGYHSEVILSLSSQDAAKRSACTCSRQSDKEILSPVPPTTTTIRAFQNLLLRRNDLVAASVRDPSSAEHKEILDPHRRTRSFKQLNERFSRLFAWPSLLSSLRLNDDAGMTISVLDELPVPQISTRKRNRRYSIDSKVSQSPTPSRKSGRLSKRPAVNSASPLQARKRPKIVKIPRRASTRGQPNTDCSDVLDKTAMAQMLETVTAGRHSDIDPTSLSAEDTQMLATLQQLVEICPKGTEFRFTNNNWVPVFPG